MSTAYRIKHVAERSGFSAATLRYYEEIGLLPPAERTAAGYRVYDDRTLARLEFIGRAKQLGCSLEEIADLASAWEGGRCGPVQDRLRAVVAEKVADAHERVVEMIALTAELQRAAAALERHRPEGACDDRCGCVSAAPPAGEDAVPIACTLGAGAVHGRIEDWRAVLDHVRGREQLASGVRLVLGSSAPLEELTRLLVAEQDCCRFFAFALTVDSRGVGLEVTAPPEAQPVIESLFGSAA